MWSQFFKGATFLLPIIITLGFPGVAGAEEMMGGVEISIGGESGNSNVQLFLLVAMLSLSVPLVLSFTHFTYIMIVFSLTRQALGTQSIPPNQVMIALALFISTFMMYPLLEELYEEAYVPMAEEELTTTEALQTAEEPMKEYLLEHTYLENLEVVHNMSGQAMPDDMLGLSLLVIVPAFLLTQIAQGLFVGVAIYFAFSVIDMILAGLLMYMGMMMLPPLIISMSFKLLVFIYLGGYSRITELLFTSTL